MRQQMAGELFALVTSGQIKIPVERRDPLDQVAQAHRDLEARVTTGAGSLVP